MDSQFIVFFTKNVSTVLSNYLRIATLAGMKMLNSSSSSSNPCSNKFLISFIRDKLMGGRILIIIKQTQA